MLGEIRAEFPGIGSLPSRDFGWFFYCASRPLIELVTRRQAERLPNLTVRSGRRVLEITATPDGAMVTGVRCESADGRQEILAADLVVDASGRGAPTLACSVRPASHYRMKSSSAWTSTIRRPAS
jgi:L-2-hydroxyglutarate oxidase LhgO